MQEKQCTIKNDKMAHFAVCWIKTQSQLGQLTATHLRRAGQALIRGFGTISRVCVIEAQHILSESWPDLPKSHSRRTPNVTGDWSTFSKAIKSRYAEVAPELLLYDHFFCFFLSRVYLTRLPRYVNLKVPSPTHPKPTLHFKITTWGGEV